MTMDLKKLLSTTPETLAQQQREALLREVESTFGRLVGYMKKGELDKAREMLGDSPAGDGHGCDNVCVSFNHVIDPPMGCFSDIGDILHRLAALSVYEGKVRK